jgi:phage-related protein
MSNLSAVWNQVEALLSQKISIIPVRDKDEEKNGKTFVAKTPYFGWKKYQSEIIGKDELWGQMEKFNTDAIAIICGKISGNLEVIDIDVKYYAGFDAILFTAFEKLYPELFARLRIHKTPSGGYHLLYRVDGRTPEGNMKLAARPATDEELAIKSKEKIKNFLETRGEGGYIVAPPSLGYSVHTFVDIPVISWEERCTIIELCKSFNQIVKVVKEKSNGAFNNDYYDENPFDHYNNSPDAENVLSDNGWELYDETGTHLYFTRPGKSKGISASFVKSHRLFYFFTSSTEFEEKTWYSPATVLAKLQFRDDKKRLFAHLISNGFGKIKPKYEKNIVRQAVQKGAVLPQNISEDALEYYNEVKSEYSAKYPAGIFWKEDDDGISISREKLYRVSEYLGVRLFDDTICLIEGYIVKKVTERVYFDALRAYVKEEDADLYENIINTYEAFLQKSGAFTITRLPILDTDLFLTSDKRTSFKFYQNCYLKITAEEVVQCPYSEIGDKLIWEEQIQKRNYAPVDVETLTSSLYYKYLHHAIGITPHLQQCIGYLAHEHKDEEAGYIVVLTEQCENPKQGGGSGKNIFTSLFSHTTTIKNIPGTQVQYNEKFLQAWDFERILSISDVPKRFDFSFLKELSTGSGILKKLWKDETSIKSHDMPKLVVSTNFSYEVSDGGLRRRIIPIEFTNFFTEAGGVREYFNAMFPTDWTENDWLAYDNIIVESIQSYLSNKGRLKAPALTDTGWKKQFEHEFNPQTYQFITENIEEWKLKQKVNNEDFNRAYNNFCAENNIQKKFELSSPSMNRALEVYCKEKKINFKYNVSMSVNGIKFKGRLFDCQIDDNEEVRDYFTLF